jgi:arsenate reductase
MRSFPAERGGDPGSGAKPFYEKKRVVLFLCTGNSCRSQIAEGWARHFHGDSMEVYSAGTASHGVDPKAVQVMAEEGIDISGHSSTDVRELLEIPFDVVVTVCDSARESCPVFPGRGKVVHHSFDDPPYLAAGEPDEDQALAHYRRVRDEIRDFVETLPRLLDGEGESSN